MKRRLTVIFSVLFALFGVLGIAACKEKEPETPVAAGEEAGEYYCDFEGEEYSLSLTQDCRYTLTMGEKTLSGNYRPMGETLTFSSEEEAFTATYFGGIVTLTYEETEYKFLRKIEYHVTFESGGGTEVGEQTVLNGRKAVCPKDPEKAGNVFVGWYTDSLFKSAYSFNEPVRGDVKLYARFVEPIDPEFNVKFDLCGAAAEGFEPMKTTGHRLFHLPQPEWAGHQFLGWWVSVYESAEKPTFRYEEQMLEEDTTLYAVWAGEAPAVSVQQDKIVWTETGTNRSYNVTVTNLTTGNEEGSATTGQTSFAFDFSQKDEGDYEIAVTVNGKTGKAYYRNKGLSRVSAFEVLNNTLLFNGVPNATGYLLSIECGNPAHDHSKPVPLGAEDEARKYDFSECDMKDGAITFKVTAEAKGYLPSVSEPFRMTRTLAQATGIEVDRESELLSWTKVENAASYDVVISSGSATLFSGNVEEPGLSLKYYGAGSLEISVTPKARGWNPPAAAKFTYSKTSLAAPTGLRYDTATSKIVWTEVSGAKGYEVKIGDTVKETKVSEIEFTEEFHVADVVLYPVVVRALGEKTENHSLWSDALNVRYGSIGGELRYRDGAVSWDPVFGVHTYYLKINGGEERALENVTSAPVTFTQSGTFTLSLCALYADGSRSGWIETSVRVYEIFFDAQGGENVPGVFVARGDKLTLPPTSRYGFDFNGWFTEPSNGDGYLYNDDVFVEESDRTLYAQWTPHSFHISLNVGIYGIETEEIAAGVDAYYHQPVQLPVPETRDATRGFKGWYDSPNGDLAFTGFDGLISSFNQSGAITLYAQWVEVLSFTPVLDGSGLPVEYQVSKSRDIALSGVEEITIPQTYNGKPVTTVVDFTDCRYLHVVRIPDSIRVISIAAAESAFSGCRELRRIEIYETDYRGDKYYSDDDGVLLYKNPATGAKEIKFYPLGREETGYRIPDGVQTIPSRVFSGLPRTFTELTIPASVTLIEREAVYYETYGYITTITFLAAEAGVAELPLVLQAGAFTNVDELVDLTLPARMTDFKYVDMFTDADKIENVDVVGSGGSYSSIDGVVVRDYGASGKELVFYPTGRKEFTTPTGITSIGEAALKENTVITSITIPHDITNISREAFYGCEAVKSIVFEGTESDFPLTIGEYAFARCDNDDLEEIVFPANLVKVGAYAFEFTEIYKVTVNSGAIPGQTLEFAPLAFGASNSAYGGPQVTELVIGPYVKDVNFTAVFGPNLSKITVDENNPYYDDSEEGVLYTEGRKQIVWFSDQKSGTYTVPDTVTQIAADNFKNKSKLTGVVIPGSVTYIGVNAFQSSGIATVTFKEGSEPLTIDDGAFSQCASLVSVEFPERLVRLGAKMFRECKSLRSVHLPATLEEIVPAETDAEGNSMLGMFLTESYSTRLPIAEITVAQGNKHYSAVGNVLYQLAYDEQNEIYYESELLYCPIGLSGEITVPNTVEKIWKRAFDAYSTGRSSLTSLKFNAEALGTKYDPESGARVPIKLVLCEQAIYNYDSLTSVVLPRGTSVIGKQAFYHCGIASIVIPNTVEKICKQAFQQCTKLKELTFESGNETLPLVLEGDEAGSGFGSYQGIFYSVPIKSVSLPERTTVIGSYAFANASLQEIEIPSTVTEIGEHALMGNYSASLKTVRFAKDSRLQSIGTYAFYNNPDLEEIVLPKSLVTIGSDAFNQCTGLRSVVFEDGSLLEYLGERDGHGYVFGGCTSLTTVNFGADSHLKYIVSYAFIGCTALERIVIPASIEEIGEKAFWQARSSVYEPESPKFASVEFETKDGVSNLRYLGAAFQHTAITEFTFPETAGELVLQTGALQGCLSLERVHIGSKVYDLRDAFRDCPAISEVTVSAENPNYVVVEGQPFLSNKNNGDILLVFGKIEGELHIPEGSLQIGASSFMGREITKVYIPRSVIRIGDYAFKDCKKLTAVEFADGSSLTSIGVEAFSGCDLLSDVNFDKLTQLMIFQKNGTSQSSPSRAFYGCASLSVVDLSKTQLTDLPNAFEGCTGVTVLKLPSTLATLNSTLSGMRVGEIDLSRTQITSIPESFFAGCERLLTAKLPNGIASIGARAFEGCSLLREMDLGNKGSLTLLNEETFKDCAALTTVKLPVSIEKIGEGCFQNCASLTTINLEGVKTVRRRAFFNCGFTVLTLPVSVTSWGDREPKPDDTWDAGKGGPDPSYAVFGECANLSEIIFPSLFGESVSLQAYMFAGCDALKTLTFEQGCSITTLPEGIFSDCAGLSNVRLPKQIKSLGTSAFKNCVSLTTFDISDTEISALSDGLLSGCTKLAFIRLPEALTSIPSHAFEKFTSLQEITLPASVGSIGSYAFDGCTALKSIVLPEGLTEDGIGSYAFRGCILLTSIDFSKAKNLTTIGNSAFMGCTGLTKVELPATIDTLYGSAFSGCTSLSQIEFGGVKSFGSNCLSDTGITSVRLNEGARYERGVFANCAKLQTIDFGNFNGTLAEEMFSGSAIKTVSIPNASAFGSSASAATGVFKDCRNLSEVTLPEGLRCIPNKTFSGCEALTDISIPASVRTIGDSAFEGSGLKSVDLSKNTDLSFFGSSATGYSAGYTFRNCVSLTTVILPEGLDKISAYVFYGCTQLSSIGFEHIVSVGEYAFADTDSLGEVTAPVLETVESYAFYGSGVTSFHAPVLETVESYAFRESGLTSFEAPLLETVESYAFRGAVSLTAFSAPMLTTIEDEAFRGSGIRSFTVPEGVTVIGNSAFAESALERAVFECGDFKSSTSPFNKKKPTGLFRGCESLKFVSLPDGITDDFDATSWFDGCGALKTIEIPSCITNSSTGIKSSVFGSMKIENLVLKESFTEIFAYFADHLSGVVNFIIPKTVGRINLTAFRKATEGQNICFMASKTEIDEVIKQYSTDWRTDCAASISYDYPYSPEA